jgi:hypothetical protein
MKSARFFTAVLFTAVLTISTIKNPLTAQELKNNPNLKYDEVILLLNVLNHSLKKK